MAQSYFYCVNRSIKGVQRVADAKGKSAMMNVKQSVAVLLICVCAMSFPAAVWANEKIPPKLFSAIIIKALNYDRSLDRRIDDAVNMAIVYEAHNEYSKTYAEKMREVLRVMAHKATVRKFPITAVALPVSVDDSERKRIVQEQLAREQISVVLVLLEDAEIRKEIIALSRLLGINTFSDKKDYLSEGLAFAILAFEGKPKLYVNVTASKAEGSEYSGKLLSLCEQIN